MPKCDKCKELAHFGKHNYREVPTTDPEGWREFTEGPLMKGCDLHVPVSLTYYLDGRVVPTEQCRPEKTS